MKKNVLAIMLYLFYGTAIMASDTTVYKYSLTPFFSFDNYNFEFIERDDSGPKNFKYSNTQNYSTGIHVSYYFKERLFIKGGIGYLTKNFRKTFDNTGFLETRFDFVNFYQGYLSMPISINYSIYKVNIFSILLELGIKPSYLIVAYDLSGYKNSTVTVKNYFTGGGPYYKSFLFEGNVSVSPSLILTKRITTQLPITFIFSPQKASDYYISKPTIGYSIGLGVSFNF